MLNLTLIKKDLAYFIVFCAFTSYLLRGSTTEILLQMIILAGIVYVGYKQLDDKSKLLEQTNLNTTQFINKFADLRNESNSEIYGIPVFPAKNFAYLHKNKILVEIVLNLRAMNMFDFGKYSDLILLMNQYQKVYIYLLVERYDFDTYFTTFIDIGEKILELLYAFYFVSPIQQLKHIYGYVPYITIEQSITRFTVLRRKMISVLESFGKKQLKIPYIQETLTKPSDSPFDPMKARMLP